MAPRHRRRRSSAATLELGRTGTAGQYLAKGGVQSLRRAVAHGLGPGEVAVSETTIDDGGHGAVRAVDSGRMTPDHNGRLDPETTSGRRGGSARHRWRPSLSQLCPIEIVLVTRV